MKTSFDGDQLWLELTAEDRAQPWLLDAVRGLPCRKYVSARDAWRVDHVRENWTALRRLGLDLNDHPEPTRSASRVEVYKRYLSVYAPPRSDEVQRVKQLPDGRSWKPTLQAWICRPTGANVRYLRQQLPHLEWDEASKDLARDVLLSERQADELLTHGAELPDEVVDYKFGGPPPFKHQRQAFLLSRDAEAFALLMEQGTGKTKVVIDTACWLNLQGRIDGVLVICPNGVKSTWREEVAEHSPDYLHHEVVEWEGGLTQTDAERLRAATYSQPHRGLNGGVNPPPHLPDEPRLPWLVMNVESYSTDKGKQAAERFLAFHDALMVVDECTRIKTPGAKRTKAVVKLGKHARYRRIMTGTPVTQGPLDVYAPFRFLDPAILGFSSYYPFRNHFAVMGGFNGKQVVAYSNLDELKRLIGPYSFRVTRDECLDLPPKLYKRVPVALNKEQQRLYRQLRDEMTAEFEGQVITVNMVLTQLLRLRQVVGGFLPRADEEGQAWEDGRWKSEVIPIPGKNPKLAALLDLAEDIDGKVVIWACFRPELDLIGEALTAHHGEEAVVMFHGGVNSDERTAGRHRFQDPDDPARFFVGQTETGGIGITLTAASTVIYFSNSFSLESRLQSEDRTHRIGQRRSVTYIDLVAPVPADEKALKALRDKRNLANIITGDNWREWI